LEDVLALFRHRTGREPTPDELGEVRQKLAEEAEGGGGST
jgi:hypothetical protein